MNTVYYYEAKTPQEQLEFLDCLTKNTNICWENGLLPKYFDTDDLEDYEFTDFDHVIYHIRGGLNEKFLTFSTNLEAHKVSTKYGVCLFFDGIVGAPRYKRYELKQK